MIIRKAPQDRLDGERRFAIYSDDEKHRYLLYVPIRLFDKSSIAFIGLNPSTATELEDDNTVRRCIDFAKRWGYGSMYMLNIFSFRSTDPDALYEGNVEFWNRENMEQILLVAHKVDKFVLAWGNHGDFVSRGALTIKELIKFGCEDKLYCLGLNRTGHPKHPLYIAKNTELIKYEGEIIG